MSESLLCECSSVNEAETERLVTNDLQQLPGNTCLTLALAANHEVFLANSSVHCHLDHQWLGKIKEQQWLAVKCIFGMIFPMYIPFIEFKDKIVKQSDKSERIRNKM